MYLAYVWRYLRTAEVYLRYVRRYFLESRVSGGLKPPFLVNATWSDMGLVPHITQIDLRETNLAPHITQLHDYSNHFYAVSVLWAGKEAGSFIAHTQAQ
jgi:hypothetical protein